VKFKLKLSALAFEDCKSNKDNCVCSVVTAWEVANRYSIMNRAGQQAFLADEG